jgi:hypothetical protein
MTVTTGLTEGMVGNTDASATHASHPSFLINHCEPVVWGAHPAGPER